MTEKYRTILIYVGLALVTLAVFWQAGDCEFVNYDDPAYVSNNAYVKGGLRWESLSWAFTTGYASNWHPLTWLSLMLDCELFGTDAGRHHQVNLVFHIANALLLFGVLKRMTGAVWRSGFVAAVFALHPLHVESVAWISERKDVLSTLFWILTMWAYAGYVERPRVKSYLLMVLVFGFGLMAKPMLVSLPFVLLMLDYWPLKRFDFNKANIAVFFRLLREKVPLFILSAISSIITVAVQQRGGAVMRFGGLGVATRIGNALVSYAGYIGKMVWPSKLAVFYPHPVGKLTIVQVGVAFLLLLVISIKVVQLARSHRYVVVGWLWYLVTLLPVIGLVQIGNQALADRYSYVTLTGLFIIIGWGIPELTARWRYRRIMLGVSAATVLLGLSICTRLQMRHWRNSVSLFEHALEVTEGNYVAHCCLAEALRAEGKVEEAIAHNIAALRIWPTYPPAHNRLGLALIQQGKVDEAIEHYKKALRVKADLAEVQANLGEALIYQGRLGEAVAHITEALRIKPRFVAARINLGYILAQQGKRDEAIAHFTEALRIEPDSAGAHNNLGYALLNEGQFDRAISHFTEALRISPDYFTAENNLGEAFLRLGRAEEAAVHFTKSLQIEPNDLHAHYNLGLIMIKEGECEYAIRHFKEVLRLRPNFVDAINNLGWVLATCGDIVIRDAAEAVKFAEKACELTGYNRPDFLDTLAAAYAAGGNFPEAVKTAEKAITVAAAAGQKELATEIQKRLELYKVETAYYRSKE